MMHPLVQREKGEEDSMETLKKKLVSKEKRACGTPNTSNVEFVAPKGANLERLQSNCKISGITDWEASWQGPEETGPAWEGRNTQKKMCARTKRSVQETRQRNVKQTLLRIKHDNCKNKTEKFQDKKEKMFNHVVGKCDDRIASRMDSVAECQKAEEETDIPGPMKMTQQLVMGANNEVHPVF